MSFNEKEKSAELVRVERIGTAIALAGIFGFLACAYAMGQKQDSAPIQKPAAKESPKELFYPILR